jgi:hypothetical protein
MPYDGCGKVSRRRRQAVVYRSGGETEPVKVKWTEEVPRSVVRLETG